MVSFTTLLFRFSGEITIPSCSSYDPVVHLNCNNISVDSPTHPSIIKIRIKCSKTDPFHQGVDVYVGKTNQLLCPITSITLRYMVRIKACYRVFRFSNGSPLTKSKFVKRFRTLLQQAGANSSLYSGHSYQKLSCMSVVCLQKTTGSCMTFATADKLQPANPSTGP